MYYSKSVLFTQKKKKKQGITAGKGQMQIKWLPVIVFQKLSQTSKALNYQKDGNGLKYSLQIHILLAVCHTH